MSVKTQFSIKDLENLSGVKAHTIRIWEKRYNILQPERTQTNIRKYNLISLKKLLNITHLYRKGHKISKIAALCDKEIVNLVNKNASTLDTTKLIKDFKEAMFAYDNSAFLKIYDRAANGKSFRTLFFEVLIPLLEELGILWHVGSIDPSHERFVSEFIRQKIYLNIEEAQQNFIKTSDRTITLFLPLNELHEIGILYAHYELIKSGFKTIYLGENIPLRSLNTINDQYDNMVFITYLTTEPKDNDIDKYFKTFVDDVCAIKPCELWCLGSKVANLGKQNVPKSVKIIKSVTKLNEFLEKIKV